MLTHCLGGTHALSGNFPPPSIMSFCGGLRRLDCGSRGVAVLVAAPAQAVHAAGGGGVPGPGCVGLLPKPKAVQGVVAAFQNRCVAYLFRVL